MNKQFSETKTAEQFFSNYFESLILLAHAMPENEFRKALKKIYSFVIPECKESFNEFYHGKADTDRKVINRLYNTTMLYKTNKDNV